MVGGLFGQGLKIVLCELRSFVVREDFFRAFGSSVVISFGHSADHRF